MTVCNVCGKETPTGSYVLIDGKPVCFNCSPKESDDDLSLFNVREKIKPKKIICPYCNEGYSPESKKCPKCNHYNPMFDFPFGEYFINLVVAYLAIFVLWSLFLILTKGIRYGITLLFSPIIVVGVLMNTIGAALLFYIGRWIRSLFSK